MGEKKSIFHTQMPRNRNLHERFYEMMGGGEVFNGNTINKLCIDSLCHALAPGKGDSTHNTASRTSALSNKKKRSKNKNKNKGLPNCDIEKLVGRKPKLDDYNITLHCRVCSMCDRFVDRKLAMRCNICKCCYYCSVSCQLIHWRLSHRKECNPCTHSRERGHASYWEDKNYIRQREALHFAEIWIRSQNMSFLYTSEEDKIQNVFTVGHPSSLFGKMVRDHRRRDAELGEFAERRVLLFFRLRNESGTRYDNENQSFGVVLLHTERSLKSLHSIIDKLCTIESDYQTENATSLGISRIIPRIDHTVQNIEFVKTMPHHYAVIVPLKFGIWSTCVNLPIYDKDEIQMETIDKRQDFDRWSPELRKRSTSACKEIEKMMQAGPNGEWATDSEVQSQMSQKIKDLLDLDRDLDL